MLFLSSSPTLFLLSLSVSSIHFLFAAICVHGTMEYTPIKGPPLPLHAEFALDKAVLYGKISELNVER